MQIPEADRDAATATSSTRVRTLMRMRGWLLGTCAGAAVAEEFRGRQAGDASPDEEAMANGPEGSHPGPWWPERRDRAMSQAAQPPAAPRSQTAIK